MLKLLEKLSSLKNIGQFDAITSANAIFSPFTVIYAENGRGKTTLASILHSLATGDPSEISNRHRLGATYAPHVVVNVDGKAHVYQNGRWNSPPPNIVVFDDDFVSKNVCSGMEVATTHRQKLHELILGEQGVALNATLQTEIAKVEDHNSALKVKSAAIAPTVRGEFTVEAYCALKFDRNIDDQIRSAERRVAAAQSADAIRHRPLFNSITLPDFDIEAINRVLSFTLSNLEAEAALQVREHLHRLGKSGESWVAQGMELIRSASENDQTEICPFCVQNLDSSPLIGHYQGYFSAAYADLKRTILELGVYVRDTHAGDVPSAFERQIRTAAQNHEFWKEFASVPEVSVDTAAISVDWSAARETVLKYLRVKAAAPLDRLTLGQDAVDAIINFRKHRDEITALSDRLMDCNSNFLVVKEQASADEISALSRDLSKFRAIKQRFDPKIAGLCDNYLKEKAAKKVTEDRRNKARDDLENYRKTIFPAYEAAINDYLRRFSAAFRVAQFSSVNARAGSSASYCMVINEHNVELSAADGPSFRNTLSAGDRNTLALAFFFASLEQDALLSKKIVVFDDPMTSLDKNRTLTTKQEIQRLNVRCGQIIVLSHSKPFLCSLWDGADKNTRKALRISRAKVGSDIFEWDVRSDSVTEHDKRYTLVSSYLQSSDPDKERAVAAALRPILEVFIRVAFPSHFPPGSLLGPFVTICQQRMGTSNAIMSTDDTTELRALLDYGNRFHHDSNSTWETAVINDGELVDFARRTLLFVSRG